MAPLLIPKTTIERSGWQVLAAGAADAEARGSKVWIATLRRARVAGSKYFLPAILVTACFAAYVGNGDVLPANDQVGNMLFSVNLLKRHSFTISPPDAPQAFFRTIESTGEEPVPTAVDEWTESTDAAYREGRLAVRSHFSYMSPTVFPEAYVNTFGIGAPLAGLPMYAVLDLFVDIEHDRFWWWHGAALTASLLIALATLFVFLAARGLVKPVAAALLALAFGLGSKFLSFRKLPVS